MPNKHRLFWSSLGISSALLLFLALPVRADDFTKGFKTTKPLARGSVVVVAEDKTQVEPALLPKLDSLLGAVVNSSDVPVTLTNKETSVLVATNGRYEVLVSDINGPIKAGDFLTASSLSGVAMKADPNQPVILGKALQDLDTTANGKVLSRTKVKGVDDKDLTVAISRILVEIDIGKNPYAEKVQNIPSFLLRIGETIADKPVSPLRIYGSLAILLIVTIVTGTILFSGVRNSLVAIGRNPLSKKAVLLGLAQVVFVSVVIFTAGIFAIYLVLKA